MGSSRAITVHNGNVLTTASATVKVGVQGAESMVVVWSITDSGATGDIGTTTVKPYSPPRDRGNVESDPVVLETLIPATAVAAVTRVSTLAAKTDRYDVRGLEQVELKMVNAAAGTKDVEIHVYLFSS